jgi:ribosomal protein S18 acetylase RimI-like enzyme
MTDMIVKLYDLPPHTRQRAGDTLVRRALASEKPLVIPWVRRQFGPGWAAECEVAFGRMPATCFIALQTEKLVGFCVYDSTARGMLGPIGVAASHQRRGIGRELLLTALAAMHAVGYAYAVVGWVAAEGFFQRVAGATTIPGSKPGLYIGCLKKQEA